MAYRQEDEGCWKIESAEAAQWDRGVYVEAADAGWRLESIGGADRPCADAQTVEELSDARMSARHRFVWQETLDMMSEVSFSYQSARSLDGLRLMYNVVGKIPTFTISIIRQS